MAQTTWETESDYLDQAEGTYHLDNAPVRQRIPHPYLTEKEEYELNLAYVTTNVELLRKLYGEGGNDPIRHAVIGNEHCPEDILLHALEWSGMSAWYAAGNPSTPVDALLKKLKETRNENLAWRISTNPSVPKEIRDRYSVLWEKKKRER